MIVPVTHEGNTKKSYLSFYNKECECHLKRYLESRKDLDSRLFILNESTQREIFKRCSKISSIKITPQILRKWFCCEMANLGVQDRYVDAFCGRVPQSVLARHYTDYSPERLKEIYDKANISVLS